MKNAQIIKQAAAEVTELIQTLDSAVNAYLEKSGMDNNQKIVNIGRALGAYHVAWVAGLSELNETQNGRILNKIKKHGAKS